MPDLHKPEGADPKETEGSLLSIDVRNFDDLSNPDLLKAVESVSGGVRTASRAAAGERFMNEFVSSGRVNTVGKEPHEIETKVSFPSKRMNLTLWIVQVLLALIFLFAGGLKLILSPEVMTSMGPPNQIVLPGWFLRFIGVAEVLGAIGLILPGLLRIRPGLTPLAATGLVIIMIGAVSITLASGQIAAAFIPLLVGLLSSFVAYARRRG